MGLTGDEVPSDHETDPRPVSAGESYGGRARATEVMRHRAKLLERRAADWRNLANVLDAIENEAVAGPDGQEGGPHIGRGSQAERFLWMLASEDRG